MADETNTAPTTTAVIAYCFRCRTKREMKNPQPAVMKNGRPATNGECPECGTKMFRMGKPQ